MVFQGWLAGCLAGGVSERDRSEIWIATASSLCFLAKLQHACCSEVSLCGFLLVVFSTDDNACDKTLIHTTVIGDWEGAPGKSYPVQ